MYKIVLMSLAFATLSFGATQVSNPRQPLAQKTTKYYMPPLDVLNYSLSALIESYSYKETEDDKRLMKISGIMAGLRGGITHNVTPFFAHSLSMAYLMSAKTNYDGQVCAIGNPSNCQAFSTDSKDSIYYVQYVLNPRVRVDLLNVGYNIGVGYRFLFNDINDDSAYRRAQHYLYYILGFNLGAQISRKISTQALVQYRGIVKAWNKTYMTDIDFDRDLSFNQPRGNGYYLALRGDYRANSKIAYFAKLYYEYWHILESDSKQGFRNGQAVGYYVEPNNYTQSIGLNLGLVF
ncbi:hypothetical protein [Helicobacter marmotae]|uniref:Outer membrane beta-barrel protein n=1 Tax=Helicobacter marmotae TaxID=152490 RepID=A0A3D8I1X5_9HELI|nr:hypothetical protein [Helicobacter marmotae]RDU59087.1 hypothetical protein CQA63_08175 [Helicobacter marmotae]